MMSWYLRKSHKGRTQIFTGIQKLSYFSKQLPSPVPWLQWAGKLFSLGSWWTIRCMGKLCNSFSWCLEIGSVGRKSYFSLVLDWQIVLWSFYFSLVHNFNTLWSTNCCCHTVLYNVSPNSLVELISGCLHSNHLRMFQTFPRSHDEQKGIVISFIFNICLPQMLRNLTGFRK